MNKMESVNKKEISKNSNNTSRKVRPLESKPVYTQTQHMDIDMDRLKRQRLVALTDEYKEAEYYKILRTQILHKTRNQGWNVLAITSPNRGEGKTLTSINLAITFAREISQTVLLVDADLRKPAIHRVLGITPRYGLSDYLIEDVPIPQILIWPGIEKLTLLPGGVPLINSAELLASPKMRMLVDELKNRYQDRYILFDCAPVLTCADMLAFSPFVDGIVMVIEAGKTREDELSKAIELLETKPLLGLVLNKAGEQLWEGYPY